jgi:hypothetical protein
MSTTNEEVVRAWTRGQEAKAGNLWTDGRNLYSYSLLIGKKKGGENIVFDYTSRGGSYYSQTTSTHVGLAALQADQLMNVDAALQALFIGG